MFRRSFLSSLATLPFFSFLKKKEESNIKIQSGSGHVVVLNDENPKNLPVALFDENGIMKNAKEILGDKKEALVFVSILNSVHGSFSCSSYGEMKLKYYDNRIFTLSSTETSLKLQQSFPFWCPKDLIRDENVQP